MKITFYGQCTFLIEAGGVRIVTDPYLTDSIDRGQPEGSPWHRAFPAPVTLSELNPDVILISHAHGDHFDRETLKPYYEAGGAAALYVPEPVLPFAAKLGLRARPANADRPFRIGDVTITPVACAHQKLRQDDDGHFFELSYLIEQDGKKVFFGGDMSLYDGLTEKLTAMAPDVMLLPVNGADYYRTATHCIGNTSCIEAAKLAKAVGVKYFIPTHHDVYYPYNGCRESWIRDSAADAGVDVHILKVCESEVV